MTTRTKTVQFIRINNNNDPKDNGTYMKLVLAKRIKGTIADKCSECEHPVPPIGSFCLWCGATFDEEMFEEETDNNLYS